MNPTQSMNFHGLAAKHLKEREKEKEGRRELD